MSETPKTLSEIAVKAIDSEFTMVAGSASIGAVGGKHLSPSALKSLADSLSKMHESAYALRDSVTKAVGAAAATAVVGNFGLAAMVGTGVLLSDVLSGGAPLAGNKPTKKTAQASMPNT